MKNKLLQIKNKLSDNKKRAVAWLLVGSLILGLAPIPTTTVSAVEDGEHFTETNTGDMNRVPYNNEGLTVDLSANIFGTVAVGDNNGDGVLDIIIGTTCEGMPGTQVFYGQTGSQDPNSSNYMTMKKAVKKGNYGQLHGSAIYNGTSYSKENYKGTLITNSVFTRGTVSSMPYAGTFNYELPHLDKNSTEVEIKKYNDQLIYHGEEEPQVTIMQQGGQLDGYSYSFADYDGDGDLDLIYSINSWADFGWSYGTAAEYDDSGVWDTSEPKDGKEDQIYGWVFWFENKTQYESGTALWDTKGNASNPPQYGDPNVIKVVDSNGNENPLTTYSHPEAKMYDFDNDGDLDIVCGSWIDEITYYENTQADEELDAPKFKEGRPFVDEAGNDISAEHMELSITAIDWNEDGWMDLVVSEEDTRVFLLENTGVQQDGTNTPIMKAPQYFQQEADSVKVGGMSTPYSIDWDGDGDEDLISGDSAGFISFVKNLSKEEGRDLSDPSWDKPVRFKTSDGEDYHITARMEGVYGIDGITDGSYAGNYGSIQGPAEQTFGYTKLSVADWDGDGILDIMSNNVRGEIYVLKGTAEGWTTIDAQEMVQVEWGDEGYQLPQWYDRPYDQRKYYAEAGYLIGQWRTTPFMIDLNDDDKMDIVMLDHEGYLAYYERLENGTVKPAQRIFKDKNGKDLGLRVFDGTYSASSQFDGKSGRRLFTMVDYDLDGDLDLIVDDQVNRYNIEYRENISETPGEYVFEDPYSLHTRNYAYHTPCPTVCDWNQDDIPDLLVGAEDGYIYYLKNTVVKTPEESLVAHWDFEGDSTVALTDKGTAGNAENNLTIGGDTGNVSIENGIATIKSNGYLTTPNEADLNQTGEMTLFARVFVTGDKADITGSQVAETSFIDKRNGSLYAYSMGIYGQGTSDYAFTGYVDEMELSGNKNVRMAKGAWREIAAVVTEGEDGSWTYTLYMSKDGATASGADFEQVYTTTFTNHRATSAALIIGNTFQKIDSSLTRRIDDVRIYDMALTTDQMAKLLGELPISESLVAHWDFEGDATEQLKDKAVAGAVKDDLQIETGSATTNVVVENGIATFKNNGLMRAGASSVDLNQKGEMTILMRAYVDGNYTSNKEFAWLDKRDGGTWQYWIGGYQASTTSTSYTLQSEFNTNASIAGSKTIAQGAWREIAVVVKQVEGVWTYEWYMSTSGATKEATDFTLLSTTNTGTTAPRTSYNDLILGCRTVGNSAQTINTSDLTRKLDDVRIYNTALTTSEMAGLLGELPLSENLVAHWDFEGDATEALADKATAGKTKDNLTKENESNVSISDGIATFTGNGALNAGTQNDLQQTGEMTIFMRAYVEGNHSTDANKNFSWIDKRSGGVYQYYIGGFPESTSATSVRLQGSVDTNNLPNGNYLAKGVWREIAIVAKQDGETWRYEWYVSNGATTTSANDYTLIHQMTGGNAPSTNGENLILGCLTTARTGATLVTSDLTRKLDDVRIYNTALSTDEMAKLLGELPESATTIKSLEIKDAQLICTTVGDSSVLDTIVVKALYQEGERTLTKFDGVSFEGFDSSQVGEQTVTVSYEGCQTTITIRVYAYGDIDGNGTCAITDLVRLKKIEAGLTEDGYVPADMNARKLRMHLVGCDTALATLLSGKNVSILGDSISTYGGYSNDGNANSSIASNGLYYSEARYLSNVNYTWWKQLATQTNMNLLVNNSYSGGRVGGHADDVQNQGINRALQLHNNAGINPDVIVVYLGVNDLIQGETVEQFTEDYTAMIKGMTEKYSAADVFVMTHIPNSYTVVNSELAEKLPAYNEAIKNIAETYQCTIVDLYKESGMTLDNYKQYMADGGLHPNAKGMDLLTRTVYFAMCEKYLGM